MLYVSLHTGRHTERLAGAIKRCSLEENNALYKPHTKWDVVSHSWEILVAQVRGLLGLGFWLRFLSHVVENHGVSVSIYWSKSSRSTSFRNVFVGAKQEQILYVSWLKFTCCVMRGLPLNVADKINSLKLEESTCKAGMQGLHV